MKTVSNSDSVMKAHSYGVTAMDGLRRLYCMMRGEDADLRYFLPLEFVAPHGLLTSKAEAEESAAFAKTSDEHKHLSDVEVFEADIDFPT